MSPMLPALRDPLGLHPIYYRADGSGPAASLDELRRRSPAMPLRPDAEGIQRYLRGDPDDRRTCALGISLVPTGHRLARDESGWCLEPGPPLPPAKGELHEALVEAIADILEPDRPLALALSGGLDSALCLAIALREFGRRLPVFTLAIDIPGYGERQPTRDIARRFGVELHEIPATADDYREHLATAIAAVEVPMFNPHPVSKLLLAQALRREGFTAVLTGDAADQIFSAAPQRNYLPLVGRLFRSQGIEPCSPFFDPRVLAHAAAVPADPHKRALRAAAEHWLPASKSHAPKTRRLAPDLEVETLVAPGRLDAIADRLGIAAPRMDDPRQRCGYTTLCMLWDWLERA